MKLLISNQHGAIVMALMPFLYGMLSTTFVWQHIFLLLAWFSLYLMTYPFLSLFKGRNLTLYKKWALIYGSVSFIFALPTLFYNWHIIYFLIVMLPFVIINIYYTKKKNERALINDLAGIVIFAIAGMASYYFSKNVFDKQIWFVALYPSLLFIGTTLYVKSVMRERKNPIYLKVSILYHLLCIILFAYLSNYKLVLAFTLPLIRAIYIPIKKLSIKQIGIWEIVVSLYFFTFLILSIY
ncbi:YwiC-like protein [Bisgaardia hudsonensis]|uniref:YwiC-like protein n=1 Tax=Bisgaardia hudsonensis TaxID=109472 RepID=A0A4R2N2B6_9PAST|nr:YwiC-like family protein [Bisgaardia hudsonensis]QLB12486.1 hypothetical protein A6A11_02140 [Bisgaardia hudsonensis]TCP14024.1 YwiC-like protein [Bisgaardia hudsonensis]